MSTAETVPDPELLLEKIEREQKSRAEAERLLEDKSRELFLAKEKVREQYDSLQATQGQLVHSEKMASVGQLAAGVAHEINNPVGFVTSNVQTLTEYIKVYHGLLDSYSEYAEVCESGDTARAAKLKQEIDDTKEKQDLEYLVEDTADLLRESGDGLVRVREIVQNLKSFVHLDKDEVQLACVNECLEATLKVVWNELKYKCEVKTEFGDIPQIHCYAGELNQVFLNLLVNAAHAIEESGTVSISSEANGDEVVVRIADTGRGISPENMEKLFRPVLHDESGRKRNRTGTFCLLRHRGKTQRIH